MAVKNATKCAVKCGLRPAPTLPRTLQRALRRRTSSDTLRRTASSGIFESVRGILEKDPSFRERPLDVDYGRKSAAEADGLLPAEELSEDVATVKSPTASFRGVILCCAGLLLASIIASNRSMLFGDPGGMSRCVLGLIFSVIILLRGRNRTVGAGAHARARSSVSSLLALGGVAANVCGIVFRIHQFEWIGVVLVLVGCLLWGLPRHSAASIGLVGLLLYMVHPLPGQAVSSLQFVLQRISVAGAERILHILNVRVWADGLLLRTPTRVFGVPEACSGMTTAITVAMCAIGISAIAGLGWRAGGLLVVAGLGQVVALNMARVALMIALCGYSADVGWGDAFLHDTLGVLLIAAVLLVYIEALSMSRHKRLAMTLPDDARARSYSGLDYERMPAIWSAILRRRKLFLSASFVLLFTAGVLFKTRPYHRSEMISGVAADLVLTDRDQAERAFRAALQLNSENSELQSELARTLLLRGKNAEALLALEQIPEAERGLHHLVLEAWGLVGIGRSDEAQALVRQLSAEDLDNPGIAMVEAELAVKRDDFKEVETKVLRAADWDLMADRIRALFPYLAAHQQWETIRRVDMNMPYMNLTHGLIAVHAKLKANDVPGAAQSMLRVMRGWPTDPELLRYLYAFAVARPLSRWEDLFALNLAGNLESLVPDELAMATELCFQIRRPDLAWLGYLRLAEVDPGHPSLMLLPAWFGDSWFVFRKRFVGLSSGSEDEVINITPETYHHLVRFSTVWQRRWSQIPLVNDLSGALRGGLSSNMWAERRKYLSLALERFADGWAEDRLSQGLAYRYVTALELAGRKDDAHVKLDEIAVRYQGDRMKCLMLRAAMYERDNDWQAVYEILREPGRDSNPQLQILLMLCDAQVRLRLGPSALDTVLRLESRYPSSAAAAVMRLGVINEFVGSEEALFGLDRLDRTLRARELDVLECEALFRTGRIVAAERFLSSHMLSSLVRERALNTGLHLEDAESILVWRLRGQPSMDAFDKNAAVLRSNLSTVRSEFLGRLMRLWLDCDKARCSGDIAEPGVWTAAGRDAGEEAVALSQLTLLLCRYGYYERAARCAAMAVELMPESALLWRQYVGVAGRDWAVLEQAHAACPDDPEIWLGRLVMLSENPESESQVAVEVKGAVESGRYPPATMARAAEFLLRKAMAVPPEYRTTWMDTATVAARDAGARSRGLGMAHIVALRCALWNNDRKWAEEETMKAIEASPSPHPLLYRKLVELKEGEVVPSEDLIDALKRLRQYEPGNAVWAELLGYTRFQRGQAEMVDATTQMLAAIEAGHATRTAYAVAAEATRRMGNPDMAVDLLRKGLDQHPNDLSLLNNLVYTLALDPLTVGEAVEKVPLVMSLGGTNEHVLDTAAVVFINAGAYDKAEKVIARQLALVAEGCNMWARALLHSAEIQLLRGNPGAAQATVSQMLNGRAERLSDQNIYEMDALLREIEAKKQEAEDGKKRNATADNRR